MKIALMTNNYKPFVGGVPISVERLAEGLRKEGHEVVVFAPTYERSAAHYNITAHNSNVEDYNVPDNNKKEQENEVRYHSLLKNVAGGIVIPNPIDPKIEREFKQGGFDVIHVHHPIAIGNTAIYLSRKYNVPLIFTYHTRYEQYLHYLKPIMWLEKGAERSGRLHKMQKRLLETIQEKLVPGYLKYFIRQCHHVFAPTEGMREYLIRVCALERGKVSVLPTGLKAESFCFGSETYKATDCPLFISVSRLAHEKNIPFLLHALAYYKMMYKKPFKMLLIGDGPNRKEYEELVKTLRLENEIVFTGLVPNDKLPEYYQAADAFLFASKTETQGIVILEAMAAGTPVIAVRASGVSDLVVDDHNGYLVKEEVSEFAERIYNVSENMTLQQNLRNGAIETAFSFHEERIAKKAAIIYQIVKEEYQEINQAHVGQVCYTTKRYQKKYL